MKGLIGIGAFLVLAALSACAGRVKEPAPVPVPDLPQQTLRSFPTGTVKESAPEVSPPQPAAAVPRAAPVRRPVYKETGVASWYGKELHGNKTASGGVFDREGLTAAHRTLPLGTVIRVTNLGNSKSIDVTITDRGPFVKNRILDV